MALTAREKTRRDAELVRLRMQFPTKTWEWVVEQLAADKPEWALSVRQAQDVYSAWQSEKVAELADPVALEIVQEHIAGFRQLREDAAEAARESLGGFAYRVDPKSGEEERIEFKPQPSNVIGALKLIADLRGREIALMQETNLLPRNLGRIDVELDVRRLQEVVLVLIDRFVPEADRPNAEMYLVDALSEQLPSRALAPSSSG